MPVVRRIDQIVPTLAGRDAIGQHTLRLRDLVRHMGLESDVFYLNATADVLREGRPIEHLADPGDGGGRVLIYQLSIGSPAAEAFARRPEPKAVNYHNITPAELLRPWEPVVADELVLGRLQMARLAPLTTFAFADSAYNESELRRAGFRSTAVSPLLIDLEAIGGGPGTQPVAARAARGADGHELLFVGKVAPHKAEHDLIKALDAYRRLYDPRARLRVVGSPIGSAYPEALGRLAERLGIADAVSIEGSVSHDELVSRYRSADVFVCLSDHEGFCVPLVEAMVHGLPVVAFGAGAVQDTVGDGGLVLPVKEPVLVAAAIDRVMTDEALRSRLARGAARRVEDLALAKARTRMTAILESAIEAATSVPVVPDGGAV